jgi:hypothetical protein
MGTAGFFREERIPVALVVNPRRVVASGSPHGGEGLSRQV